MRRGEIRWYKFRSPDKRRPVLIITRDSILEYLGEVTVAPITSTVRDIPSEVFLSKRNGMKRDCAINLDHVQTVEQARLRRYVGSLSPAKMRAVCRALAIASGCDG